MQINIPNEVYELMNTIENEGYEAYLVGGLIRDAFLNRDNKDYDITTNMNLDDLRKKYPNLVIMKENNHRNTGVIKINGNEIEVSTFRGKTLKDDLLDRDFRMNALACDKNGNIIDEVCGIDDINNKKISLIKEDGYGFITDPLRIIRAVRFAAILDFEIDEETNYEIERKVCLLEDVARERIYSEIVKIFTSDNFTKVIRKYPDIFSYLVPEFDKLDTTIHNHIYHTNESVLEHTLMALDKTNNNLVLRLATFFHDVGKPKTMTVDEDGTTHFHGHPKKSAELFLEFAKYVKMDYDTRDAVKMIIENHDRDLDLKDKTLKRFMSTFDINYLDQFFDLVRADVYAQNPKFLDRLEIIDQIEKRCHELIDEETCLSIKDLDIDGADLMFNGFSGREIGEMLNLLLSKVIDEELENKNDVLLKFAIENRK
ncbi:MAG: HD domain-containing protein [Clostridia bacterium]|nr:HD domain-containing protein [Clostridia bacterium]